MKDSFLKRNILRVASVWMDEYAKYYYQRIGFNLVSVHSKLVTKMQSSIHIVHFVLHGRMICRKILEIFQNVQHFGKT